MDNYSFQTISTVSESKRTEKNSRFLGFAYPITSESDIKTLLDQIKVEHPKANHHCYAWRLGIDQQLYRANDDGEPSGSAGRPILGQIDSFSVTNILVVVVRYFGGTKLGVSGLIKAYKACAKDVLSESDIILEQIMISNDLKIKYEKMTTFRSWMNRQPIKLISENYTDHYGMFEIKYPKQSEGIIQKELKQFIE